MGSNQTTVVASGIGAALGTVIAIGAKAFGVDVSGTDAVALGGALAILGGAVVGYLHKPKTG